MDEKPQHEPLTDEELIKWVSIIRAQKRLPKILAEATGRYVNEPVTEISLVRIRTYIDEQLEEMRNPKMGELMQVVSKVNHDGQGRVSVELFTVDEIKPKRPKTALKRARRGPK